MLQTVSLAVATIAGLVITAEAFWMTLYPQSDPVIKAHILDGLIVAAAIGILASIIFAVAQHLAEKSRINEAKSQTTMLERIIRGLPGSASASDKESAEPLTFREQVIRFVSDVRKFLAGYKEPMSDDAKYAMIMQYVNQFAKQYFAIKHHLETILGYQRVKPLYSVSLPMSKDAILRTTNLVEGMLAGVPPDLPAYPPELDTA